MRNAFTTRFSGRTSVLFNDVSVCLPTTSEEANRQKLDIKRYIAIWDTGATHSAVTEKVVEELGLKPTGVMNIRHAGGMSKANTYLVNLVLPDNVIVSEVRVTEVKLIPDDSIPDYRQPQLLIGMDVIGLGDFVVTNHNNKTAMSFRVPSVGEIDFVLETREENVMEGGNRKAKRTLLSRKRRGKPY